MAQKHVVVTGASSGIGLALCKLLATEHSCYVYLGTRNLTKGAEQLKTITDAFRDTASKIELLQIDVGDDASCAAAAASLKAKGVTLYALVNNAGTGLSHKGIETPEIFNTNYKGPKRVTEAMVGLIDPKEGRIVNTSSGGASMWLRNQDAATKALFSNPDVTEVELNAAIDGFVSAGNTGMGAGYGLSKAGLVSLTMIQAKAYPNLKVTSLSPGFIDTPLVAGFGAKLTPEQGCVSSLKCLFEPVTSGWYYGSDGLRSPLVCTRDPGMPVYEGEAEPDPTKYNR